MTNELLNEQEIIARFREAVMTIKRLPPVRVQGYFNAWPEVVYSRAEIRDMDKKPKFWTPTPEAISRMEESIKWISFINKAEDKKLVWMRASNVPWGEICKNFGICRSAANKRYKKAIDIITQKHLY